MRIFHVLVFHSRKGWLKYPENDFNKCLKGMETLKERGFQVKAETTANGITETLSLQEMREMKLI